MAGLKWGIIIGIVAKLADTLFLLGSVDPGLAILFLIAIGICFIPRIGIIGIAIIAVIFMKFSKINFFLIGIAAALTGGILGSLPGMAIGGIIGYYRRNSIARAHDAGMESKGLFLKAVLLPLITGFALFGFYIFVFNPWLTDALN
jgi:hypothetical protein